MWIQSWLLTFLSNAMTMWFSFDYSAVPFVFKTSEQLAYRVKHSTGAFYCCASACPILRLNALFLMTALHDLWSNWLLTSFFAILILLRDTWWESTWTATNILKETFSLKKPQTHPKFSGINNFGTVHGIINHSPIWKKQKVFLRNPLPFWRVFIWSATLFNYNTQNYT